MSDYERHSRRSNRPQDEEYNYDDDYQTNRNLSGVGSRGYSGDMDDDWQMSNPEELRSSGSRGRSRYQGQGDMSGYEQGNRPYMGRRSGGGYGYEGGDYGYGYEGGEPGQSNQYGMNRRRGNYGYEGGEPGQSGMRRGRQMGMGNRRGGRGESGFSDYEGRSYTGGLGTGYESDYDTSYGGQGQYGSSYRGYEEGQQYGGQMGSSRSSGGRYAGVGPEGYQRSDQRIEEEVNERLMWHGDIDASKMRVKVKNGEVTLEGTVEDRWQKRMAVDAAHEVRGVKDVHNQLRIQQNQGTESRQNAGQQDREYTDSSATKQQGDRKRQTSPSSSKS